MQVLPACETRAAQSVIIEHMLKRWLETNLGEGLTQRWNVICTSPGQRRTSRRSAFVRMSLNCLVPMKATYNVSALSATRYLHFEGAHLPAKVALYGSSNWKIVVFKDGTCQQ